MSETGAAAHAATITPVRALEGTLAAIRARLRRRLGALRGDESRRSAFIAFAVRIVSAGLLYLSQAALARWTGGDAYGVYVVVWTWVLVLGGIASLGLNHAVIRLVAEYRAQENDAALRGVLIGSRMLAFAVGTAIAALGAAGLWLLGDHLGGAYILPAYLGLVCIPMFALTDVQDGIGRGRGWIGLGLVPPYILRPALVLAAMIAAHLGGLPTTAATAVAAAIFATWATALIQMLLLGRAFAREVPRGPRRTEWRRWLTISTPLAIITACEIAMQTADVIAVAHFLSPTEVGIYFAAAKTMSLILYVQYAVGSAMSRRFAAARALDDRSALETAVRDAVHWTFWPSLACAGVILALGKPLLGLFGPEFAVGYPAMFVLVVGYLARSAVGPGEYLLRMSGAQHVSAAIYVAAAVLNVVLCFALVPTLGLLGAALGGAIAMTLAAAMNWYAARRWLAIEIGIWAQLGASSRRPARRADQP